MHASSSHCVHLFHMRLSALTGAHRSTANRRNELEESDLNTKAASVFTVLDTDKDGSIAIVELWSGLMDLGYFPNEISTILGLAAKMRKLHADNPAHYIHATDASDLGDALGSPFGLRQIRKAQVLSPEDVMAREAGKARQTVPAASSGANVGSSAAEQSLGSEKPTGSPLSGDADRREAAGRRDEERPENNSMPRVVEFKDESRGSRCDIEVLEVKEMFPAVTKVEFARGMGQAVMQMSPERRSRWCANVDMRGEVFHALPKEICGVDGKLSAVKRTPYRDRCPLAVSQHVLCDCVWCILQAKTQTGKTRDIRKQKWRRRWPSSRGKRQTVQKCSSSRSGCRLFSNISRPRFLLRTCGVLVI